MKCMRCGEEMRNTIGGCYTCDNCGFGFDDCVLRYKTKDGKAYREANVIDSKDLGTLGAYFEADAAQKKTKELEKQITEKDKEIKELKSRLEEEMDYKFEYYHYWQEMKKEIKEYNNYFKSFGCKNFSEFQELIALTKVSANDKDRYDLLRHQVCEEIKKAFEFWYNNYNIQDIRLWFQMQSFLKLIEQGEKK